MAAITKTEFNLPRHEVTYIGKVRDAHPNAGK